MTRRMQALVQRNNNDKPALTKDSIPVPEPGPHQLLVKISHVAQNPTDIQSLDRNAFGDGTILGCDFVSTVESLGQAVTRATDGDAIAGLIWGGNFQVPASISRAAASTVPLAAATAWLALFSKDCLNIDRKMGKDNVVLVWGGSSSVGLYTIQTAALFGFKVITTCSPRNFDLVKASGATHVFDYSDPGVIKKIREVESNLQYVFDTIGNEKSSSLASETIREQGGGLCTVRPGKANTDNVTKRTKVTDVLVWTAFFKDHRYADFFLAADHELAAELFENLPAWLESGKIKPNVPSVKKGLRRSPRRVSSI